MSDEGSPKFDVRVRRKVDKRLERIPEKHQKQILRRIFELANAPRPQDSRQLHNDVGFRIDVGEYRILYDIDYPQKIVTVYLLMNRQEGYKRHGL